MMKKYIFILAAIFSFVIISQGVSRAMTVTAAPNPANVNQTVTATVNATFTALIGTNCVLDVNFGDSGAWTGLPVCTSVSCIRNIGHSYTSPGSYTITARPRVGACFPTPNPPSPASTNISVLCPSLAITSPATLPQGTVNNSYSYQVQASGGAAPYSYAIISGSLPPGLGMNTSGFISGIPSAAGTFNFTVRTSDNCFSGSQTAQRTFTITVVAAPCPPLTIISPAVLSAGKVAQSYSYQVLSSGGVAPVTYGLAAGTLPPGLSISPSGLISGTPTIAGSYNFTVSAEDSCGSGVQTVQKTLTININPADCPVLNITSPSVLTSGTAGQPYTYQILASGGVPPVTYGLASGALPQGLNVSPAGLISGMPAVAGTYNFAITASDTCISGGQEVQRNFTLVINPASIAVQVTPIPASFSMARNAAWTQNIAYIFTGPAGAPFTLDSTTGIFRANNTVIGESNTPLSVSISNGTGNVPEVLNIPVAISERAENLGTSRITYSRIFSDGMVSVTAQVEIMVTTGATAEFKITRMQLYFENNRGEITVQRNQPSLIAYMKIDYTGSALLRGFWEVDGRILAYVNQHLAYGKSIILSSPEVPSLPTFVPGNHIVRFVITPLPAGFTLPEGIYFVTADESGEARTIGLVMPEDDGRIGYEPYTFGWKNASWANTYLVEFFSDDMENPIFSAFTRKSTYLLPPAILTKVFAAAGIYQWRVKGYDAEGNIIGESALRTFSFSE